MKRRGWFSVALFRMGMGMDSGECIFRMKALEGEHIYNDTELRNPFSFSK